MIEHQFKKRFGQNFISDTNLLQAIVTDAGITNQDTVLEIGAGAGTLTAELAAVAKKVVSYEIDFDLQQPLLDLKLPNVEFVFQDALKTSMADIEEKVLGSAHTGKEASAEHYKLVANLPYYITTPLLFKFLEEATRLKSMTIMVQKEVALRMIAEPNCKDYGILTLMIRFYGRATLTRTVGRQLFYPQPNVDSAVVHIEIQDNLYPDVDKQKLGKLVKASFSMRRKTMQNNLLTLGISKDVLQTKVSADLLKKRAENLSIDDYVNLYHVLREIL